LGAGYNVIEALHLRADMAEAVKADAPFAGVDGLAELSGAHKIDFLEVAAVRRGNGHACLGSPSADAGNLFGQANVHDVARFAALDQPQGAVLHEPAQGGAHGFLVEAEIPRHPIKGKMKARLAFEAAVPEKVVIDGPVGGGEAQTRSQSVLELLADKFGIGLFGFHDDRLENRDQRTGRKKLVVDPFDHGQGKQLTAKKGTKTKQYRGSKKKRPERIGAHVYPLLI